MLNGAGFVYPLVQQLWIVDVETGEVRRLTDLPASAEAPTWSPDGTRIAFAADLDRNRDLRWRSDVHVVDVATGARTRITGGGIFGAPVWLPDGKRLAVIGNRLPARAGSRNDLWLFAADGSESGRTDGQNLSARHDLMPGSAMNSDLTIGEEAHLAVTSDGTLDPLQRPDRGCLRALAADPCRRRRSSGSPRATTTSPGGTPWPLPRSDESGGPGATGSRSCAPRRPSCPTSTSWTSESDGPAGAAP